MAPSRQGQDNLALEGVPMWIRSRVLLLLLGQNQRTVRTPGCLRHSLKSLVDGLTARPRALESFFFLLAYMCCMRVSLPCFHMCLQYTLIKPIQTHQAFVSPSLSSVSLSCTQCLQPCPKQAWVVVWVTPHLPGSLF
jgi:hypothetical protein